MAAVFLESPMTDEINVTNEAEIPDFVLEEAQLEEFIENMNMEEADAESLRTITRLLVGGALVGIAGASYSLNVKIGWAEGATRGLGWIALAIVIFGGWSPIGGAMGAILFAATRSLVTVLQRTYPEVPATVFLALPWILMIAVLVLAGSDSLQRLVSFMPESIQPSVSRILRVQPPAALGTTFEEN